MLSLGTVVDIFVCFFGFCRLVLLFSLWDFFDVFLGFRSRELRLNAIRDAILELRGGGGGGVDVNETMPSTRGLKELFENHKSMIPNAPSNSYTEKVQSFFPSCRFFFVGILGVDGVNLWL